MIEITLFETRSKDLPILTVRIDDEDSGGSIEWLKTDALHANYPFITSAHELASWAHGVSAALSARIQNSKG